MDLGQAKKVGTLFLNTDTMLLRNNFYEQLLRPNLPPHTHTLSYKERHLKSGKET